MFLNEKRKKKTLIISPTHNSKVQEAVQEAHPGAVSKKEKNKWLKNIYLI